MARKKEAPKPLFAVKFDFSDSLDNMAQQAINLIQVVETALDLDQVAEPSKSKMRAQLDAFRKSLLSEG